jgi:uncharacterized protein (DUF2236 family)
VRGTANDGRAFRGDDPALLEWVHATACFGFLEAYRAYVRPLTQAERDAFYAESRPVARLYGATSVPDSERSLAALFERMEPELQRSDVVAEFLTIVRRMPLLPAPLRPLQRLLVDASIALVPERMRERIGVATSAPLLSPWRRRLVGTIGRAADRIVLRTNPAVLGCRRVGLADDFLFARR